MNSATTATHYIARSATTSREEEQYFHLTFNRKIGNCYYDLAVGDSCSRSDGTIEYEGLEVVKTLEENNVIHYRLTICCVESSNNFPTKEKIIRVFKEDAAANDIRVTIAVVDESNDPIGDDDIVDYPDMPIERPIEPYASPGKNGIISKKEMGNSSNEQNVISE